MKGRWALDSGGRGAHALRPAKAWPGPLGGGLLGPGVAGVWAATGFNTLHAGRRAPARGGGTLFSS